MVLWAQSTPEDYIRAENKLHFISQLFIKQDYYNNAEDHVSGPLYAGNQMKGHTAAYVLKMEMRFPAIKEDK